MIKTSKKVNSKTKKSQKTLKGEVVSTKMQETAVVRVTSLKFHPLYKKRYRSFKKYLAHNQENKYKVGDRVLVQQVRPISKRKRWAIKSKIS